MNKILLIPVSFNPITNAHVDMALTAKKSVNADMIYFIPAHDTYVAKKRTLILLLSSIIDKFNAKLR